MLVIGAIVLLGILGLTPMGPVIVGLEIAAGFIFWRAAVQFVRPSVDHRPLTVGYLLFGAGWIVASFGVSGMYPWIDDANSYPYAPPGNGLVVLFGGAPTAFGVLAAVGVPGSAFLLRRGRLDYRSGALLVAFAIVVAAVLLRIAPVGGWDEAFRWDGFVAALRAGGEYLLPPAALGMAGLVFAVDRQQRAGGARPPGTPRPVRLVPGGIPVRTFLASVGVGATVIVMVVAVVVSASERRRNARATTPVAGATEPIQAPYVGDFGELGVDGRSGQADTTTATRGAGRQ